jgi:hypothetical protein
MTPAAMDLFIFHVLFSWSKMVIVEFFEILICL